MHVCEQKLDRLPPEKENDARKKSLAAASEVRGTNPERDACAFSYS